MPRMKETALVEIRAGTGGEEAALFASDLLRMYAKYSEIKNWKTKLWILVRLIIMELKEVVLNVSGKNVFGNLNLNLERIESKEFRKRNQAEEFIPQQLPSQFFRKLTM